MLIGVSWCDLMLIDVISCQLMLIDVFLGYLWWKALSDVSGTIAETANQNSSTAECWPAPGFGIVFVKVLALPIATHFVP